MFKYRPFHKTLPRSSAFINWISVRFYETDCNLKQVYDNNKVIIASPNEQINSFFFTTVCFIKPYRNLVYKCTGFMKWAIL